VRRAFTLVEALVAITIASILLVVLWQVFSSAQRETVDAERRLQSVSTLERVSQALEADLALLAPMGPNGGLLVLDKGATLKFYAARHDPSGAPGKGQIVFAPAAYRFNRATHEVLRAETRPREGAVAKPLTGVPLLDLRFRLTARLDLANPLSGGEPPDALLVQAVWAPADDLRANRKPLDKDVVSLSLSFGLAHLSDDARYPGWVTNPTSKAVIAGE
jgi:prepilin-type N-terminal cleavage/methylation domain-containing protein